MRPNSSPTIYNTGSSQEDVKLGLDASATAHLISVLTDLYSDPIKAVVREYSTNALDAHIESGNNAPIEITLPTSLDLNFRVRDIGLGLSLEGLRNTYSLYGRSTKRESDDVNGVLGLGCKSGLTYGNSFNVAAVKDGERVLALIVKDEDGVGVIKILETSATTEPNSVEITIPVRERDIQRFRTTAESFFYYWHKGSVVVDGEQPNTIWDSADVLWLDDDVCVVKNNANQPSVIVQHNVAYPVKSYFFDVPVVAFVPVGSINFTPSREALHYTPRTDATLAVLKDYVADALPRSLDAALEGATAYGKLQLLKEWRSFTPRTAKEFFASIGGAYPRSTTGRAQWLVSETWNRRGGDALRAAKSSNSWLDLVSQQTIVTGYTASSVSPLAKARIKSYFPDKSVLLLPSGTNLDPIEGRPNVHTWDDVLTATASVKLPKNTSKGATEYSVRQGTTYYSLTAADLEETAEGAQILYVVDGYPGDYVGPFPQAFIVTIKARSEAKFQRLFPAAKVARTALNEALNAARAAINDEDLLSVSAARYTAKQILAPVARRIEDPLLRTVLLAASKPSSDRLVAFTRLGGSTWNLPSSPVVAQLEERYPLVESLGYAAQQQVDDIVIYVNAKYASINK